MSEFLLSFKAFHAYSLLKFSQNFAFFSKEIFAHNCTDRPYTRYNSNALFQECIAKPFFKVYYFSIHISIFSPCILTSTAEYFQPV